MTKTKKKFYYGWVVVLAAFLCHFVSTGLLIYTFSLFVVPMSEVLDVPRTTITLASTFYTICIAVFSPIAGAQIAKGRARPIIVFGAVLFGAGYLLLATANNLPMFYLFYALLGIGCGLTGPVMSSALAMAWFEKKRGLAVGIANCGSGIAALFIPTIIANISTTSGIQTAFVALGIIAFVILGIAAILVKSSPQDIGLMPDGLTKEEYAALPKEERSILTGITRAQALKTPAMWMICIALMVLGFAQLGVMQNAAAFLNDLHFDMKVAAIALGAMGVASMVGRIVFGLVADRIEPKLVFCAGNVILIIGSLFLAYTQSDSSLIWLMGYAILFGFGIGSWSSTMPLIVGKSMGIMYFGAIWGVVFGCRTVGDMLGVPGISALADVGGYQIAFWVAVVLFAVSAVLILAVRKPQVYAELEEKGAGTIEESGKSKDATEATPHDHNLI